MSISQALEETLVVPKRPLPSGMSAAGCRKLMRLSARRWRRHAQDKEQFELAELSLGNALGWRTLAEEAT